MKVCTNCKKELPDDAVFCDNCGTKVDAVTEVVVQEKKKEKKGIGKGLLIAGIVVVAVGLVAGVVHLVGGKKDQEDGDAIVYVSDNELILLDQRLKEPVTLSKKFVESIDVDRIYEDADSDEEDIDSEEEETEINEEVTKNHIINNSIGMVTVYQDENRVVYIDKLICNAANESKKSYSLYYRMLKGKNTDPVKIDSDVRYGFAVVADGDKLVYQAGADLYLYDFKEKKKLADDVREIRNYNWQAAEDGSSVAYVSEDEKLYRVNTDGEKKKLAFGEEIEIYKSNTAEFYYTIEKEEEVNAADYIEDDLEPLEEVTEPEYPEEPEEVDWTDYEDDADYEKAYKKWQKKYAKWEKSKEAYEEAYEEYEDVADEKENRQLFWDIVQKLKVTVSVTTLYYYDGEESREIGEVIYADDDSEEQVGGKPVLEAEMLDRSKLTKVAASDHIDEAQYWSEMEDEEDSMLVKEIAGLFDGGGDGVIRFCVGAEYYDLNREDMDDVYEYYVESFADGVYYLQDEELKKLSFVDGKTTVYDTGVTELVEIEDLETGETGKLGYWKDDTLYIEKEKIEGVSHTEEVSLCGMCDGVLYYYQDIERSSPIASLYAYQDGKSTQLVSDVQMDSLKEEADGKIYYMKDYDADAKAGSLYYLDNGKSTMAVEEVYAYVVTENGSIYYQKNYDAVNGTSDLYLHGKKEDQMIQSDVQGVDKSQWK